MRAGLFKPNCALGTCNHTYQDSLSLYLSNPLTLAVLIDLFIRLGFITPDDEPDYLKLTTRLHGQFDYEKW